MTTEQKLRELAAVCPEINMANYTEDNVRELNDWAIEISNAAEALALPTTEPRNGLHTALEIRTAQGWKLTGKAIPVLYTDTINDQQVMRDDLWLCTTDALKQEQPTTQAQELPDVPEMHFGNMPKPAAWWIPKAEQFCLAKTSGDRPFANAWEPLFTADQMRAALAAKPVTDDAELIDFLQSVARCDPKMDGNHVWWPLNWNTCQTINGPTLREAIRAAIAAQGGA